MNTITNKTTIDKLAFHFPYIENTCPSWKDILHLGSPSLLKKNNNLINVQDNKLNFYFIEQGIFQLKYYSAEGKSRGTICFGKNSLLCLASSYLQLDNTSSDIYCIRNGKIWQFNGKLLSDMNFTKTYPELINEAIQQLSTNLLIHITYATNMLLEPPLKRTVLYLLAYNRERKKNSHLPKFTQQEIAEMLNMHRVTLVNILQKFKKEGLIEFYQQQEIKILDTERLMEKIF